MSSSNPNIALFILTYNRVEDARIQIEIVSKLWRRRPYLHNVEIFHLFDGKKEWYPEKTGEDHLLFFENKGHYEGVIHLLNQIPGILRSQLQSYDVVIISSSDVWVLNVPALESVIQTFLQGPYLVASTLWGHPGALSTEFLFIKPSIVQRLLSLDFAEFMQQKFHRKKLRRVFPQYPFVERCLTQKFLNIVGKNWLHIYREKLFLPFPGRGYVLPFYPFKGRYENKKLLYSSHHSAKARKRYYRDMEKNDLFVGTTPNLQRFFQK